MPIEPIDTQELWFYVYLSVVIISVVNGVVFFHFSDYMITLTSDDSQIFTVFENKLTFVINNDLSNQGIDVKIYGFDGPTTVDISSSEFIEDSSGQIVTLEFDDNPTGHVTNIGPTPQVFRISVTPSNAGVYHGAIFITSGSNEVSVPLVLDIKPHMSKLIMLVIDGIALSIAIWSAIRYFNDRYRMRPDGTYIAYVAGAAQTEPLSLKEFLIAKKVTRLIVLKNYILTGGTIVFGIALGLTTLFDNDFISGVHELGMGQIFVLIGIGMGIGSLKEFIYKP